MEEAPFPSHCPPPSQSCQEKEHLFALTTQCPNALEQYPISFHDLHKALKDETPAHISHLNSCHTPPHLLCPSHISLLGKGGYLCFQQNQPCFSLVLLDGKTCLQWVS